MDETPTAARRERVASWLESIAARVRTDAGMTELRARETLHELGHTTFTVAWNGAPVVSDLTAPGTADL